MLFFCSAAPWLRVLLCCAILVRTQCGRTSIHINQFLLCMNGVIAAASMNWLQEQLCPAARCVRACQCVRPLERLDYITAAP